MEDRQPSYYREFLKSPQHVWLGLLTLGAGFIAASPLTLIGGATAYVLGWLYLPDMPLFKNWVDRRAAEAKRQAALAEVTTFVQRRDALLVSLTQTRRDRYQGLAEVCRNIEAASADNPMAQVDPNADPRLRKLDELMWTYLRLLTIEQSLELFLETERSENIPAAVDQAENEAKRLSAEIDALKAKGGGVDSKERFLASRLERLEVLRKRLDRSKQAEENLALVISEQERLDQQIKLIRADAVASKNAGALTARIDATVEHLDQTNKWLSEMDEFKDLAGDIPQTDVRVGFNPTVPPPVPENAQRIRRAGKIQEGR